MVNAKQTGHDKMRAGPLEELPLFMPFPHTPHSPQKDSNSEMNGYYKTLPNTGSIYSTQHGWDVIIRPAS